MTTTVQINRDLATRVLEVVDAGLVGGLGAAEPGRMCVEAAVCYAMGLPHGDNPQCVHPAIRSLKIALNDAPWSSDEARTKGMRKLAILQLGTDVGFDAQDFVKRLIPLALEAAESAQPTPRPGYWDQVQEACGLVLKALNGEGDLNAAARAAESAAESAARAAAWAARAAESAARAARAAARAAAARAAESAAWAEWAARAAARAAAADTDAPLLQFADGVAQILIDMKVPGVEWLDLL